MCMSNVALLNACYARRNGVHDEGAVALVASLQTQKHKVKITLNNAKIGDQAIHAHTPRQQWGSLLKFA